MTIYVLCFSDRYLHAKHYIGFTEDADVTRRVREHTSASHKANPLVKAAVLAGLDVRLAMTYEGPLASRTFERRLKNRRDVNKWCPLCSSGRRTPPPMLSEPHGQAGISDRASRSPIACEAVR